VPSVPAPPARLESLIVGEFPPLFEEFRAKRLNLLWRGNRDGFSAKEFHRRCDGRANTLTLIADTNGNIFGGFTPVEWESRAESPWYKRDDSLQSFLVTLTNPRGVPARKFAMRADLKQSPTFHTSAIYCSGGSGPTFDDFCIHVSTNCNENTDSSSGGSGSDYDEY
jgi:hypothetical protein